MVFCTWSATPTQSSTTDRGQILGRTALRPAIKSLLQRRSTDVPFTSERRAVWLRKYNAWLSHSNKIDLDRHRTGSMIFFSCDRSIKSMLCIDRRKIGSQGQAAANQIAAQKSHSQNGRS